MFRVFLLRMGSFLQGGVIAIYLLGGPTQQSTIAALLATCLLWALIWVFFAFTED